MGDATQPILDIRMLPYAQQVDAHLKSNNPRGPALWLGRTPASLRMLGFPDLPLRMTANVFVKISSGKQGSRAPVSRDQLMKLPQLIDEPMALLDSATVAGAIVVLTTAQSKDGLIIASVEAKRLEANAIVNLITSVYAKDPRYGWVEKQVAAGRLRYADKTKGFDTPEVSGHTLDCVAEPGSQKPSERKVLLPADLRNYREAQRSLKLGLFSPLLPTD